MRNALKFSFVFQNERFASRGTGEEASRKVMDSFADLAKILRQLKDVPLEITSAQGTSPVFRYSALFPALPNVQAGMKKSLTSDGTSMFFKEEVALQHTALHVAPIDGKMEMKIHFESVEP